MVYKSTDQSNASCTTMSLAAGLTSISLLLIQLPGLDQWTPHGSAGLEVVGSGSVATVLRLVADI